MKIKSYIYIIIFSTVYLSGCVDKFDIAQFQENTGGGNIAGDTVYVQLSPAWEGFNNPQGMLIGREPFIYVADTDNDRIVMMNLDGKILGTRSIKKPIAIAQDYELNLIVIADFDTLGQTFSAVYKLDMLASSHQIDAAPITKLLPRTVDLNNPNRKYTGVAVFFDNSFLVSRTGPNNSTFIDPDNSILSFVKKDAGNGEKKDTLIGRLPLIDPLGSGILSANNISSITTFNRRNYDMLLTLTGSTSLKVQWDQFVETAEFVGYINRLSPGEAEIMRPNKFILPEGAAIDNSGNIFIADAGKDSVFKFNSFGDELQSFGGKDIFNKPFDVEFFDQTVYVLDTGNNRILRFILSTDLR